MEQPSGGELDAREGGEPLEDEREGDDPSEPSSSSDESFSSSDESTGDSSASDHHASSSEDIDDSFSEARKSANKLRQKYCLDDDVVQSRDNRLSKIECLLLVLSFALRHALDDIAVGDLLKLVRVKKSLPRACGYSKKSLILTVE